MKRFLKQLIYGVFYLAVFAGIIYGAQFLIISGQAPTCSDGRQNQGEEQIDCGGPNCPSCGLKTLQPLTILAPQVLEAKDDLVSVIVEIRNPNPAFGAESFSYVINFYDSLGAKISSLKGSSFIYSGEIKFIIEPAVNLSFQRIARSELVVENPVWQPIEKFSRPDVQTRDLQTKKSATSATVSGLLVNNNSFKLSRVSVAAVVANNLGFRLGVSKTSLQDVLPSEQRFFSITIPVQDTKNLDPKLTKIFLEARR